MNDIRYLLLFGSFFFFSGIHAQVKQTIGRPVKNWQNLDNERAGVFGVNLEKAYVELLGKRAKRVIVAVIDGGFDLQQEDLKGMVWTNKGEVASNGKDDDGNGYVDDLHGWNFLGSSKEEFEVDNEECVREVRRLGKRFVGMTNAEVPDTNVSEYIAYRNAKKELDGKREKLTAEVYSLNQLVENIRVVLRGIGTDNPKMDDFRKFMPEDDNQTKLKQFMISVMEKYLDFKGYWATFIAIPLTEKQRRLDYDLNIDYDPRAKYPEEYAPSKGFFYGNANIAGPVSPDHGTHVAGIIAAIRGNGIGMDGVTNSVLIMPIRSVPEGDQRDWEDAAAIRYAADNGARVINMSYGKTHSPNKKMVDEAVKYALSKGVLFIRATGNDGKDLDKEPIYPNRVYADGTGMAGAWIEVGASGPDDDASLAAPFSNYGKNTVDVFAPGVEIYSTIDGNKYEAHSGTSMAAPVVSGLAALIWSYYPKLTALQVKTIIMKSVVKRAVLKDKCISGGVVNAYSAIRLAATY